MANLKNIKVTSCIECPFLNVNECDATEYGCNAVQDIPTVENPEDTFPVFCPLQSNDFIQVSIS